MDHHLKYPSEPYQAEAVKGSLNDEAEENQHMAVKDMGPAVKDDPAQKERDEKLKLKLINSSLV